MLAEGHRSILWRHRVPTTEPQRFSKLKHGIWQYDRNNYKEISSRPVGKWHQWHCFFFYFSGQLLLFVAMIQVAFSAIFIETSASSPIKYFFLILELIATTTKNYILWKDELELGNCDVMHSSKFNGYTSCATFKYLGRCSPLIFGPESISGSGVLLCIKDLKKFKKKFNILSFLMM